MQATVPNPPWVLLPCWCCQSAGGDFHSAEPVAAAWGLLYAALHALDDVEDGDFVRSAGPQSGAGEVLNASTGLIVSVPPMLRELRHQGAPPELIGELIADFGLSIMRMCGGQHCDLTPVEPSLGVAQGEPLERAWQIADLKSGTFFALACRAGARLATNSLELLEGYACFGRHLGVLIQIGDDIGDLRSTEGNRSDLARGSEASLPVAYAMSVLPQRERARLCTCLQAARESSAAEAEARSVVAGSGAGLYLAAEAVRRRRRAKTALEKACPPSDARNRLIDLLDSTIAPSLW